MDKKSFIKDKTIIEHWILFITVSLEISGDIIRKNRFLLTQKWSSIETRR